MYNEIITKLQTMLAGVPKVQIVYDHLPKSTSKYPYISISPTTTVESYFDTGHNERGYGITIRVIGLLSDNFVQAQKDVRDITDSVLEALASNGDLDGLIQSGMVETCEFAFIGNENIYSSTTEYTARVAVTRNC